MNGPDDGDLAAAQRAFDALTARLEDSLEPHRAAIRRSEGVELRMPAEAPEAADDLLRRALDHYCQRCWGVPLDWSSPAPRAWDGRVPAGVEPCNLELPPLPATCRSCGAALSILGSDVRLDVGSGWHHQCGEPQAGHFPA